MGDYVERFHEAYLMMAGKARYRPRAPGDGMGGVYLTKEQMHDRGLLDREATKYAQEFAADDLKMSFWIGCSSFDTNRAFVFTIEAARQLASGLGGEDTALKLVEMALEEIKLDG
jgi:hypothetical protein